VYLWAARVQDNKQSVVADFAMALKTEMDDGMGQLRTTVVRSSWGGLSQEQFRFKLETLWFEGRVIGYGSSFAKFSYFQIHRLHSTEKVRVYEENECNRKDRSFNRNA
jgi:hypothetical protein